MNFTKRAMNVGVRSFLLALPVVAAQIVVSQTALGPVVSGIAEAQAQDAQPKQEQETRRTPALRNKVYEKLAEAQAAAEAKDLATAASVLDAMLAGRRDNELNSYELANVYNLYAFIHYSNEDYTSALQSYENVIKQPDIPLAMEINTRFTVAQLYFVQERWEQGIDALQKWFQMTDTPNATAYVLLAQGYYQLKDYNEALKNINIAIDDFDSKGKIPKEQWYNLQRFLYAELNMVDEATGTLRQLITFYPKKQYWVQLSFMYSEQNKEARQLGAMETAYVQDMLEKDGEYRNMASLFLNAEVPYKAAVVLKEGLAEDIVQDNSKNWELLAGALRQAQEVADAIPAMEKAASMSDDGDLYARLGNIYLDADQNEKAIEAITKGLDRGGVKRPDNARLVLGMAYFNTDQYAKARDAFRAAGRDERSKKYADQWIKYMNSELERQKSLAADAD
ncbi:tetratricopeptide repeat protein [Congregibacter litoralis]|uniref:Cytochrome c biogenesis factor n=1 Tax=Congregibacter litoralis KT71 TaxID=314285 RepID=A4ABZ1_9GAMM|nr:tetratricopeptide repeat protein [Congregibacter litoralis]EAQ96441.2 Cytochrome c biogenesis factor [Congregibacter litoralis KT71]